MTHAEETGALAPMFLTKRLALRAPRAADAARIARLLEDGEVAKTLARVPHPYTEDDAARFLAGVAVAGASGASHHFAIEPRGGTDGPVGVVSLEASDGGERTLGYWIGADHQGRGFGTEAAEAILRLARDVFRIARVRSGYFAHNAASARVQEKLGFRIVGEGEAACLATGETHAHVDTRLDLGAAA